MQPLDLVAVGSAVVDRIHRVTVLPQRDCGAFVLDQMVSPGGVEANVAVAAARLGLRTGLISHIGADADGDSIQSDLHDRGVDVTRLQVGASGDTAYSLIFVDGRGDRIIVSGGVGVRRLSLGGEDLSYIRRARVAFASGYLPQPLLEQVARVCGDPSGPAFAFDLPDGFDDLEPRGLSRAHVDELLPDIYLFLSNREGVCSYTWEDTLPAAIASLHAKGVRRAAISDGERGLHILDDGVTQQIPAFPVQAVDTCGAGDVLHAALIAEWLLGGGSAVAAGRFAAAAAALSCRGWGARLSLPSRSEAQALMAGE